MTRNDNAHRQQSKLAAKIARVLADAGAPCPEERSTLEALIATLPGGRDLARRVPSLSDSGLRQARGQTGVYARAIQERRDQFLYVAAALDGRFEGKAKLRDLSCCGKDWTANVEIPGPECVHISDCGVADLDGFLERIVSEVAIDIARPVILPTIGPPALGTLRRKVADEAESRYLRWLAAWPGRHLRAQAPRTYATLGQWSDGESPDDRYHFGEHFDEQIEWEINDLLIAVVLSGIEDERYADRVREAFWESDQAIDIGCSLEEYWRSLPVPGGTP